MVEAVQRTKVADYAGRMFVLGLQKEGHGGGQRGWRRGDDVFIAEIPDAVVHGIRSGGGANSMSRGRFGRKRSIDNVGGYGQTTGVEVPPGRSGHPYAIDRIVILSVVVVVTSEQ